MEHVPALIIVVAYLLFAFTTAVSPISLVFSVPGILLCVLFGYHLAQDHLNPVDEAMSIIAVLVGVALAAFAIRGAWDDFSKDMGIGEWRSTGG
ncbi:MAG: hypothetical protein Q7S34_04400 [bacterium]|nr:hypothetical protein [bacterium]